MRTLIIALLLFVTVPVPAVESEYSGRTLVVGSEEDYPPFATGKNEQEASGFTVELWKAVAAESKINYSLRVRPFHQLVKDFKNGQVDVLINLAQSPERQLYADFTIPTAILKGAIFVRDGETRIRSEADLANKSIIVISADLAHDYAVSRGRQKQLILTKNAEEGLRLLAAGKYDAMLLGKLVGLNTLAKLQLHNIKALDTETGFSQKFSFALRKGQPDLLAKINDGLALTKANGLYDKLLEKWFPVYQENRYSKPIFLKYLTLLALISAIFLLYVYVKWRALKKTTQKEITIYQQRAQLALDGADLGLWDWHVPGGEVFFSERWCQMLGYKMDEIAPNLKSWENLVHPDDWAVINPVLNSHLDGKIPRYESEHRMLHKDGHWIWVLDRGKVMERGSRGEPLRMVGTHLDITQRKKNQAYLESLLAEQKAMLDNEIIGIAKVRDSTIVWANPTFEKMLGYDRYEMIGTPTSKHFISEEAYRAFSLECHPAVNSKKTYRAHIEHVGKDSRHIWVDLSCTILDGDNNELLGVLIDVTEQKQAEDAKLEALGRINKIASQVPGVVYQYLLRADGSSCFPYASERIREIYRVSPEEVREDASKVFAILHPEDYQGIVDSIVSSAKNLSQWQYEYRVKFADGTIRWLFGNALPNKQADGSVLWHGFITDITESRKVEALLHETQNRNALILDCAELGTWDWNLQTGRIIINEYLAKLHGYKLNELELDASNWQAFVHPDDISKVQGVLSGQYKNRSDYFHVEYRVLTKSGQWLWVLDRGAVIEYDDNHNPLRVAGTEMDITARKLAGQALKKSQERLHFALQGANDGMWDWNYETDEVYFSPPWKSMLGYADNELANSLETWSALVDPADRDHVYQKARDHVEGKSPKFEVEFRMRHKDGRWVYILSRGKLAVDSNGKKLKPLRMIGTHTDISDRKNQERQRIEQEKAHRLTLIREVHHRIKNNLQGITGILRQYKAKYPETSAPINQAISQMQSIAVIYGLQGQDSLSRVFLCELLAAIAKGVESLWKIPLKLDSPSGWPGYVVSENETVPIALVLNELAINAVKHGNNSGYVKISLRADDTDGTVQIAIRNRGNLPAGFNFNDRQHINTGLNLVASLLPPVGAKLSFGQQGALVVALLELYPPILTKHP